MPSSVIFQIVTHIINYFKEYTFKKIYLKLKIFFKFYLKNTQNILTFEI